MSLPPKDISASQLWSKLSGMERPYKLIDFPRTGEDGQPIGQVAIRILTQAEQLAASAAAEKVARDVLKEQNKDTYGYERVYADGVCVELLYRACRDPENLQQTAFPTPKDVREKLTTEECAVLFRNYLTAQLELGPSIYELSDEEAEAWIDRLVEGGSFAPLDSATSDVVKLLTMYMAFRLRPNSRADSISAGSPPDGEVGEPSESTSSNSE